MPHVLTKTVTAYKYHELSDEAKEKALQKFWDCTINYEWWEFIFEDAKQAGIKLTEFDIDRGNYCHGEWIDRAEQYALYVTKNHGKKTETYKTAKKYLMDKKVLIANSRGDDYINGVDYETEQLIESLNDDFLKSALEDYRIMLQREYEYMTSREAIIESIESNDYDFTENGDFPAL